MKQFCLVMAGVALFGVAAMTISIGALQRASLDISPSERNEKSIHTFSKAAETYHQASLRDGDYYDALVGLEQDPVAGAGELKSISISRDGYHSAAYEKTGRNSLQIASHMKIEQDVRAIYFSLDLTTITRTETKQGFTLVHEDQSLLVSKSRFGTFLNFASYAYLSESNLPPYEEEGKGDPYGLDGATALIRDAIGKATGKWVYAGITKAHQDEIASSNDAAVQKAGLIASMAAENYKTAYTSSLNDACTWFDNLASCISSAELGGKDGFFYGSLPGAYLTVDLRDSAMPFVAYEDIRSLSETIVDRPLHKESTSLAHIDNTNVPVIESGQIDFYDLLKEPLLEAIKKGEAN